MPRLSKKVKEVVDVEETPIDSVQESSISESDISKLEGKGFSITVKKNKPGPVIRSTKIMTGEETQQRELNKNFTATAKTNFKRVRSSPSNVPKTEVKFDIPLHSPLLYLSQIRNAPGIIFATDHPLYETGEAGKEAIYYWKTYFESINSNTITVERIYDLRADFMKEVPCSVPTALDVSSLKSSVSSIKSANVKEVIFDTFLKISNKKIYKINNYLTDELDVHVDYNHELETIFVRSMTRPSVVKFIFHWIKFLASPVLDTKGNVVGLHHKYIFQDYK